MRHQFFLILFLGIFANSVAQNARSINSLRQEADHYYREEQYHLAIQYYRELTDQDSKDVEVAYRLADCYLKTFNYPEAEAYYLKVYFLAPVQYPLAHYYYALMLKFNASFDEAITYFDTFISRNQDTQSLKEYVEQAIIDRAGCETARDELKPSGDPTMFIDLNLNTQYNDYAPAVRDSLTVVITSGRVSSNRQSIDERFGEGFTDNYYFEKQGNNWTDKTRQVFSVTNTRYNDGSGCFNSEGNKYYFTVCGAEGPQCKIFVTEFKNNKWNEPTPLNGNINYKSSESKHPAISYGGDTLIFSTNRTDGLGKFDLWMSINSGKDNWGPAVNLGSTVNTKLNELSPSLTAFSNVLFFASDGHEGYGGLDIYMSKRLTNGEIILYNPGSPFNSNRDDCFISFSEHELYWSSNRLEGLGGFDVKAVKIPSVISFISRLSLKKRNASRDISLKSKAEEAKRINLQASRLEEKIDYDKLTYDKQQVVDKMIENQIRNIDNEPGQFTIRISQQEFEALKQLAEERYRDLIIKKKGYLAKIKPPSDSHQELTITGILSDSTTRNILADRKILLTDELGQVFKYTRTNEEGRFKFTGVPIGTQLYLRLERASDLVATTVVTDLTVSATTEQEVIRLENIYFDFDHYRIRPEGKKVLDELASHLIRNQGVQIEIFAYADDRGSNEYNLQLTQKRGQAVAEYLSQKGVDQTGLAIIAKGKQSPKEVDIELQRQLNRRVEFYLNGNGEAFNESARMYILKKKVDWATLSLITGVSAKELKVLNGVTQDDQLKAFQPVRLPVNVKKIPEDLFFIVI